MKLKSGILAAGSDALSAKWVSLDDVEKYDLTVTFRDFFLRNREVLEQFDSVKCSDKVV